MKKICVVFTILAVLVLAFGITPVSAFAPLGGTGWVTINCNVNGASVYLDSTLKGTISGGYLDIPGGNLYSTYTVKNSGYEDANGPLDFIPGGPANIEISVTLDPKPPGGGKGWITVHCNQDGAAVFFNGVQKGTIAGGSFTSEVATTGTPYTTYSVSKTGYYTYSAAVPAMPADGQTIDLYATLNPVPTPTPTPTPTTTAPTPVPTIIGGDQGWYAVHCNVDGASVYFDSSYKGMIANGVLTVPVYTTGTPSTTYSVSRSGYVTQYGSLQSAPAQGQTKNVYVTLNLEPTPVPLPVGSGKGWYAVHCNVDGAQVFFDGTYEGVTRNGVLDVEVATTGTPFRSFEVKKGLYVPFTGSITQYPANGETVNLYANLQLAEQPTMSPTLVTPTAAPTTYSPLPVPVIIGAIIAGVALLVVQRQRGS